MNKIGIIYHSSKGSTKKMANALAEGIKEAKGDCYLSNIYEMNKDEFFANDILALGSPASDTEQVNFSFRDLMEKEGERFKSKKVFMFGSFAWRDGAYMKQWQKKLEEELGAKVIYPPIVCLESPTDEVLEELKLQGKKLVEFSA